MKVAEAIGKFDALKPNQYSNEQKVEWLSDLDKRLIDLIFSKNADDPSEEWTPYDLYSEDIDSRDLLVPDEYSELYMAYLSYKVDYYNGEYERFNNSALIYNSFYQDFVNYWNREHKPLQHHRVSMK